MNVDHGLKQIFPAFSLASDIANSERIHPALSVLRASEATYFNKEGLLVTAGVDSPVIEYDHTGKCLGLRLEPGVTNFVLDSEFKTIAGSGANVWKHVTPATVGASTMKAPDGIGNAVVLNPNKNNSTAMWYECTTRPTFNAHHCFSFFVKQNTGNVIHAAIYTTGAEPLVMANFDLRNGGSIVGGASYHSAALVRDCRIEPVGNNGWLRVSLHVCAVVDGNTATGVRLAITPMHVDNSVYLWGAQLEDHYDCTSFIKTNGVAQTRAMTFVGLQNESLMHYVDGDNFTIMTSVDLRSTVSSNHIVPGFSLFTSSSRRCRSLMHIITYADYNASRLMLSGRLNSTTTRNSVLMMPLSRNHVQKFGNINFAMTSKNGGDVYAAAMGRSVVKSIESGVIGLNNTSKLTIGNYSPTSNSRAITETGENSITGYLRSIAISKSSVSTKVLKAMTHQDVVDSLFSNVIFTNNET